MSEPPRTDWIVVLMLWAAGLGAAAQYGKISVVFDRLPAVWPGAGASLGFAVSLVGLVGIALGIVAGVLVARIGYRRALVWALAAGAALSLVQAALPPLPLFLLTRVAEGASHLVIVVAAPTLIAQLARSADRGMALTLWGSFFGVSFAVLAWAGLPLADRGGVETLFAVHGVYMGLMALAVAALVPRAVAGPPARDVTWRDLAAAHPRIYGSARIGAAAWGWLFYTLCFVSLLTLIPPFLAPGQRAFVLGAMPLVSIVVSLTLGVALLRRMPAARVVMLGFVTAAFVALALAAAPGSALLCLLLASALGLVQGASFAVVPQLNDAAPDQALANGGLAQMGNLGNTLGTPVMLAVIGLAGHAGFMSALAVTLLAGGLAHYLLALRRGVRGLA